MGKEILRQEYILKRKTLTDLEKQEQSSLIAEKLFSLDIYKKAKTVMFYVSLDDEVKTIDMIQKAFSSKKVLIPKTNLKTKTMDAVEMTFETKLVKTRLNTLEAENGKIIPKNEIDLVIIPAVAFDFWGHRIGYGQGYYDRFCKDIGAAKIGLAYDIQLTEQIPVESHDIKVDMILTDKRIIKYQKDAD